MVFWNQAAVTDNVAYIIADIPDQSMYKSPLSEAMAMS